jgi:hypothetical protein
LRQKSIGQPTDQRRLRPRRHTPRQSRHQPCGQRCQTNLKADDPRRPHSLQGSSTKRYSPGTIGDPVMAGSTAPFRPANSFRMRNRSSPRSPQLKARKALA